MRLVSFVRGALVVAAFAGSIAGFATAPVRSSTVAWMPAGIAPTTTSVATVFAAYGRAFGAYEPAFRARRERYRLTAAGATLDATATMRGDDYRIATAIGSATYESGRSGATRWRRTPAGVVRVVRSDVQGDDLDRWPTSPLGLPEADCAVAGETHGATPAWVLACRRPGDLLRWYYVDEARGDVVREVSREGSREVAIAFSDFRAVGGVRRPYRWLVSGAGGNAAGELLSVEPADVADAGVAVPASSGNAFAFAGDAVQIPAQFSRWGVVVPVQVNGRELPFFFDTGTTQILMDVGAANRSDLRSVFGHTVASTLSAGGAVAHEVPVETVDLFGGRAGISGILGNEFFLGHIVHVDYARRRIELLRREDFATPSGATEIAADMREGLPLAAASFGDRAGDRFAVDTGSVDVVLTHHFAGDDWKRLGVRTLGRRYTTTYLEGPVEIQEATVGPFQIGTSHFDTADVDIETVHAANLDIPLDGILGTELLRVYEWWFDYSGNRLWIRPNGTPATK